MNKPEVLLAALTEIPYAKTFVEMGSLNFAEENQMWGHSTLYLGEEARRRRGKLYTVDIDPVKSEITRQVVAENKLTPWVEVHTMDGVEFLATFSSTIPFLYLDGPENPLINLEAFQAAEDKVEHLVAIDDCNKPYYSIWDKLFGPPLGKGQLVIPYAEERGWAVEIIPTVGPQQMAILRR